MRESRCSAQTTFDFYKRCGTFQGELNYFIAFRLRNKLVQLKRELGGVNEEIAVELDESEERLQFSNFLQNRPFGKHFEFCGVWRHTSTFDDMTEVQNLVAEQRIISLDSASVLHVGFFQRLLLYRRGVRNGALRTQ